MKKFRQKYNFFIAEGPKIVSEILDSPSFEIVEIYALQAWLSLNESRYNKYASFITTITEKEMSKVSSLKTPNVVLILAKIPDLSVNHSLMKKGAHILCDKIRDPGNMGTIIRTADWFGISSIIATADSVDFFNPKVVQSSMGSISRMPLMKADKNDLTQVFKDIDYSIAATMDGDSIYTIDWPANLLIVIGNESQGVSEDIKSQCSKNVAIPRAANSITESLNAAIATSIICAEYSRLKIK